MVILWWLWGYIHTQNWRNKLFVICYSQNGFEEHWLFLIVLFPKLHQDMSGLPVHFQCSKYGLLLQRILRHCGYRCGIPQLIRAEIKKIFTIHTLNIYKHQIYTHYKIFSASYSFSIIQLLKLFAFRAYDTVFSCAVSYEL